jgi:hypothetical protein
MSSLIRALLGAALAVALLALSPAALAADRGSVDVPDGGLTFSLPTAVTPVLYTAPFDLAPSGPSEALAMTVYSPPFDIESEVTACVECKLDSPPFLL